MASMHLMNDMMVIVRNGRNFYACDYELDDDTIYFLASNEIIEKTGNSKSRVVEVGCGYLRREVEIYEWCVTHKGRQVAIEMARKAAHGLLAFVEETERLC